MDNKILDDIKQYAQAKLMGVYGYCGVAEGPNMVMLNSGKEGENLIIKIEDKKD